MTNDIDGASIYRITCPFFFRTNDRCIINLLPNGKLL